MKLDELLHQVHERMLVHRAIDAYVMSDRFEQAYERASPIRRDELFMILKSENVEALKTWVAERLAGPLQFQSYRQLREKAKQQNIPRWSRLSRDELLEELGATSI